MVKINNMNISRTFNINEISKDIDIDRNKLYRFANGSGKITPDQLQKLISHIKNKSDEQIEKLQSLIR